MIIAGTVGIGTGSRAGAAVAPGVGTSYAQSFQITPHEGALAVGLVLGEALAGHTNNVARAQSQGEDLGSIGLSLEGYNCGKQPSDQQKALIPQALQAETPPGGAPDEKTLQPTDGLDKASPNSWPPSWGSYEHVLANGTPYGQADTSYGEINGGGFTVAGMKSKAWSGMINGQREAGATSDVGLIDLAGGVVIKNMHWEVHFPSGGSAPPSASFSIGQLTIGGQAVPTNDPSAALDAANKVLGNLGILLEAPKATFAQGVQFMSPLAVEEVPNENRDAVLKAVVNPAGQAENPIANGLENGFGNGEPQPLVDALCQSDTPITVADITIASLDGGGYFTTAFGGVNATSGDAPYNPFNLSKFQASSSLGSSQVLGGTAAIAGTPGTPGTPPADTGQQTAVLGTKQGRGNGGAKFAAAVHHKPNGPLLAIGLGGLGLLALLAEADRRVIRRTQSVLSNVEE
jgi:hypothetical protein